MNPLDDIKLKKRLIAAYRHEVEFDAPPVWQQNMMRKIREIGPLNQAGSAGLAFQELVWKMAPVFSILLAILITGMVSMDMSFNSAIRDSFMNNPVTVIYNGMLWG